PEQRQSVGVSGRGVERDPTSGAERGLRPAQYQQRLVQGQRASMRVPVTLAPVQTTPHEGIRRLRIGDFLPQPRVCKCAKLAELLPPSFGDQSSQFGRMVSKVQKRRGRGPFLTPE